jgi:glycosyltransferase involved in cell wall biosynthesis
LPLNHSSPSNAMTRQTDVSFLIPDLSGGGAERVMLNLATGFAQQGLAVDLVVVRATGAYLSQVPPEIRLVNLATQRLSNSFPALIRYLKQTRPQLLIAALEDINIAAIVAKKLAGVSTKVIVTIHSHLSLEARNSAQLKRKIVPYFLRWFYSFADAVVAVSEGVAEDLSQMSGLPLQKIKVIYNPIVTPTLLAKMREPVTHPWLIPGQVPVILGVGRLSIQKDFPTLIRAFAEVRRHRDVRLLILGEGEERSHLEALVDQLNLTDEVDLPGFVPNPYAYMSHSALFVMSSAWEGFGNVLVEAMAAGTSVVSTDCKSGPAEILSQGQYGRLVAAGDVQGLAMAILKTLNEEPDPQTLRLRSEEFSVDQALSQYRHVVDLPHLGKPPGATKSVQAFSLK